MEMGEVTRISKHHSERAQGRKAWSGRRRHPAGVKGPPWKPAGEGSARAESPGARRAAAPDVSPLRSDREPDEERMSPQLREHQAGVGNWQVGQGWGVVQNNSGKKGIQNQRTPRLGDRRRARGRESIAVHSELSGAPLRAGPGCERESSQGRAQDRGQKRDEAAGGEEAQSAGRGAGSGLTCRAVGQDGRSAQALPVPALVLTGALAGARGPPMAALRRSPGVPPVGPAGRLFQMGMARLFWLPCLA